ncbi:hypothetical protein D3C78_806980 [compost metagenome]
MQVGAKFAGFGLALHRCNHLVADDEAANVRTTGFLDVLLNHDVLLEAHERLDHRFRGRGGFAQHHADALGAFQHLDHQRRTVDHFDQVGNVIGGVGKPGHRQADPATGQQLQRTQLVPGTGNGHRFVERKYPHHFELAQHCAAIKGHGCTDPWNHRIETLQRFAAVVDLWLVAGDVHVGAQSVDHHHFMATLGTGFDQTTGGIQTRIPRQHSDLHATPVEEVDTGNTGLSCTYLMPGLTTNWPWIRALEPSSRR